MVYVRATLATLKRVHDVTLSTEAYLDSLQGNTHDSIYSQIQHSAEERAWIDVHVELPIEIGGRKAWSLDGTCVSPLVHCVRGHGS